MRRVICVFLLFLIFFNTPVWAEKHAQESAQQLQAEILKVSAAAKTLQAEVTQLKRELRQREPRHRKSNGPSLQPVPHPLPNPSKHFLEWMPFRHPVTITTSPWMGLRSAFDAEDLLEQASSMNEDLTLLQQRSHLETVLAEEGQPLSRPIVEVSGGAQGLMLYSQGWTATGTNVAMGSVNLDDAELDVNAIASRWANVFLSLAYDDSPAETGARVPNSRVYLKRGFVNIGNLNVFPVYVSIGQMYMPFGRYAGIMVSTPLTQSMGRILARGVVLGFFRKGLYVEAYGFTGNMTTSGSQIFRQGGFNVGLKRAFEHGRFDIGAGVVSNIADSQGMQDTDLRGPGLFPGFGEEASLMSPPIGVSNLNNLRKRVPGADAHIEFTYRALTLLGEFLTAVTRFNPADMTFNGRGALPAAMHVEGDYNFHISRYPATFGLMFGRTWEALALNLPLYSYAAVFQISLWKDTIEAIEFRHDVNYPAGTTSSGGTITSGNLSQTLMGARPVGVRNSVLLQVGVYF